MSGEPDVSFSGQAGGLQPPGMYCYPPGFGGSTVDKPVCKYIRYPYVPGHPERASNPGNLKNNENDDK